MTAIAATGRRLTTKRGEALSPMRLTEFQVTATKHLKAGGMAMMVAAGTVEPGATGTGNVCLGVSQSDVDNSLSLSPAPTAQIETGIWSMSQTGTTITKAAVGSTVYMADDQTVTLSDSGNSPAGTCVGIDDDGSSVLVAISPVLPITSHGFAIQSRSLTLAPADFVAGQGTGADTNGTARTYNLGAALPAGALLRGYMARVVTTAVGNTTLSATIGSTGAVTEVGTALDLMGTVGYTVGTVGAKKDTKPTAAQLLVTVTPDGGSKVSAATVGEFHVTVWFADGTGI